jgi:Flp pilus assembly protein TadB
LSDDGPDSGFWWKVIGGVFLFGLAAFFLVWLLARATYAWGVGGAFIGVIIVLLVVAWVFDRRDKRRRAGL